MDEPDEPKVSVEKIIKEIHCSNLPTECGAVIIAHILAAAKEIAAKDAEIADIKRAGYLKQDVAADCLAALDAAGMGKAGHGNTLVFMVEEACALIAAMRLVTREILNYVSSGPRGCVGDHYIRTAQIAESTIERWRAALDPKAAAEMGLTSEEPELKFLPPDSVRSVPVTVRHVAEPPILPVNEIDSKSGAGDE